MQSQNVSFSSNVINVISSYPSFGIKYKLNIG